MHGCHPKCASKLLDFLGLSRGKSQAPYRIFWWQEERGTDGELTTCKGNMGSPKIPKRCGIATSYCLEVVLFIDWRIVRDITLYVSGFSPGNLDPHLVATVKCGLALLVTDTVFIDGITLANHVLHTMGIFVGTESCVLMNSLTSLLLGSNRWLLTQVVDPGSSYHHFVGIYDSVILTAVRNGPPSTDPRYHPQQLSTMHKPVYPPRPIFSRAYLACQVPSCHQAQVYQLDKKLM